VKRAVQGAQSVATVTWNLGGADTGIEVALTDFSDRSIQVSGNMGGATVTIQGSNDGVNWETLRDPLGNGLGFTASGLKQVLEMTMFIRPQSAGGAGSAINVVMACRAGSARSWS
jgi:uncharacterized membrane protein